nr:unnamed protein product [Callosobruchus analis]
MLDAPLKFIPTDIFLIAPRHAPSLEDRFAHLLLILSIYRPPSLCPLEFTKNLDIYLRQKHQYDINLIVGDINGDILSDTSISNDYLNMMSENNYNSMINGYTRIQGESKSIFFKTQESDENFNPILLNYTITDHHPILFQYSLPETKKKNQPENVKNYKTYINYTTLAQKLEKENWYSVYVQSEKNSASESFSQILSKYIDQSTCKVKIKRWEIARKKWITKGLLRSINHKKILNNLIKSAKTNYYKTKIEQHNGDNTQLWKCVKDATNRIVTIKNYKEINEIVLKNGEMTTCTKEIANEFVDYFTDVGAQLAKNIPKKEMSEIKRRGCLKSMVLLPTDENEIEYVISQLKVKKSPGYDQIRTETVKRTTSKIFVYKDHLILKLSTSVIARNCVEELKL